MRPFIQLSVVPDGVASRISIQVFDGDAAMAPARLLHRDTRVPILPNAPAGEIDVYVIRCLVAAAFDVAAAKFPYPRDAVLEALDHWPGIKVSDRWAGEPDKSAGDQPR